MSRYDMIRPRPLRPGPAVEKSQPIFIMVGEQKNTMVKGQMLPGVRPGHTGAKPPPPPQPALVLGDRLLLKAYDPANPPASGPPSYTLKDDSSKSRKKFHTRMAKDHDIQVSRLKSHHQDRQLHPAYKLAQKHRQAAFDHRVLHREAHLGKPFDRDKTIGAVSRSHEAFAASSKYNKDHREKHSLAGPKIDPNKEPRKWHGGSGEVKKSKEESSDDKKKPSRVDRPTVELPAPKESMKTVVEGKLKSINKGMWPNNQVTRWADQFCGSKIYLQALQLIKEEIALEKKRNEMWDREDRNGNNVKARIKWERDNDALRKQEEALRSKKKNLETKLIDSRIEAEKHRSR